MPVLVRVQGSSGMTVGMAVDPVDFDQTDRWIAIGCAYFVRLVRRITVS